MILMGAGTNHWFHSDQIYRAMLVLTTITGCQGRNGGGWAHYVGQEKVRPIMGFQHMAFALDWVRPPRHMNQTAYWYVNTSQYRYDTFDADDSTAAPVSSRVAARWTCSRSPPGLGWAPSYPQFNKQSLTVADEAAAREWPHRRTTCAQLKSGDLKFAIEDPEAEENFPRILTSGGRTCFGSSARATSTSSSTCSAPTTPSRRREAGEEHRPQGIVWPTRPEGKLDLLLTHRLPDDEFDALLRCRAAGRDVVREARPQHHRHAPLRALLQPGHRPAVADQERLGHLEGHRQEVLRTRRDHLGVRKDVVAKPLWHDTPEAMATVHGRVKDWRTGECEPVPGKTRRPSSRSSATTARSTTR
jgi:nitrate reductase alpha subunit